MAISKVVYKSSANATPVTWMDATPATALAADIMAPKTAMLADGVLTTGTGSGGGGGLEYETGTFTPSEDVARPTINFANTHSDMPVWVMMVDATGTYDSTTSTNAFFSYECYSDLFSTPLYASSNSFLYSQVHYGYRSNTSAISFVAGISQTKSTTEQETNDAQYPRYWVSESAFKPYSNNTTRYWRAGRTYKWIAVWAPTT